MIATRVDWLPDDTSYEDSYDLFHDMDWGIYILTYLDKKFEPGWYLLCNLMPSSRMLLWFVSILYILSIILLFHKIIPHKYWPLAFLLFFYTPLFYENISAQRSSIVISLFLFAVLLRMKKKFILAFVVVMASGLFHRSGFFLVPLILIRDSYIDKYYKFIAAVTFSVVIMCIFTPSVFNEFLVDSFSENENLSSYLVYLEATNKSMGYYVMQGLQICMVLYLLYLCGRLRKIEGFSYLILLALVNTILSIMPNIGIGRIHSYFILLVIAFVTRIKEYKNDGLVNAYIFAYCLYTFYGFMDFTLRLAMYNGNFVIYHSVLF